MSGQEVTRPGRERRSRGVNAADYLVHIMGPYELTLCGREAAKVNCFPRETDRNRCVKEEQCCKLCARKVHKFNVGSPPKARDAGPRLPNPALKS